MTDESARAVVCDSCSRLISMADTVCPYCGAGRLGAGTSLKIRAWLRHRSVTEILFAANVVLYLASLALTGKAIFQDTGSILGFLGPSGPALDFLGAVQAHEVVAGHEWWRLVTYAFLHGGILHIACNMSAIRSLGHTLEEYFGSIRFILIYMGSAIIGGGVIVAAGSAAVGASGALFGLLGAGYAYGLRRGGTFGQLVRGYFGRWTLYGVVFTFAVPNISISGHLGGLAGGFALGWLLMPRARRSAAESAAPPWMAIVAAALLLSVPVSFGVNVAKGLLSPTPSTIALFGGGASDRERLARWPLTNYSLEKLGAPGWTMDVPKLWTEEAAGAMGVAWDGGLGVRISALVIPEDLGAPIEYLRFLEKRNFGSIDPSSVSSNDTIAAAEIAAPVASQSHTRPVGLYVARKLDKTHALVLLTKSHEDADEKGWRQLFDRVVASVKKF